MMLNNFQFLIIGAGRGGTSLLAGLLDHHPQLEVGFEQFSAAYLMGRELQVTDSNNLIGERVQHFRTACLQEASHFSGKIWGNKITTEQLFGLEDHNSTNPEKSVDILDYFFHQVFPTIKIIFILRDGRTCVRSKVARTGQSIELACKRWKFSVDVYKFLKQQHKNNLCLRYENLVGNPIPTLQSICSFLGVSYNESMLTGTDNAKMLPEYRQSQLDANKLILDEFVPDYYKEIEEELRYCGYL